MNDDTTFRRIAASTAIISAPLALANVFLVLYSADFNFELMSDPSGFLAIGADRASLVRWSWLLDVFGRYFLLAPATLYLWYWLKPKSSNQVRMYSVFGLAHILIGAIAATILASVWPPMIRSFSQASETQKEMLALIFQVTSDLTHSGLFNILEVIPGGFWLIGIGVFLARELRILGTATILLGVAALAVGVGTIFEIDAVTMPGVLVYIYLGPLWALWLGFVLARDTGEDEI
jgi:hypothetical protein